MEQAMLEKDREFASIEAVLRGRERHLKDTPQREGKRGKFAAQIPTRDDWPRRHSPEEKKWLSVSLAKAREEQA